MARKFYTNDQFISLSEARFKVQDHLLTLMGTECSNYLLQLNEAKDSSLMKKILIDIALDLSESGLKNESIGLFQLIGSFND